MALAFPLSCWVALSKGDGEVVGGGGYTRQPVTFELEAGGVTGANPATIGWQQATTTWGTVDTIDLFDAATQGNWLGSVPVITALTVNQYDRVEIPPAGLQILILATPTTVPTGFGTFAFGTGNYGTTQEQITGTGQNVLLLKTWDPVALCNGEPADWSPHGPYEMA